MPTGSATFEGWIPSLEHPELMQGQIRYAYEGTRGGRGVVVPLIARRDATSAELSAIITKGQEKLAEYLLRHGRE